MSNFHDNQTSERAKYTSTRNTRAREIHEHVKYTSTRDSVDTRRYRKFRKIFTLPPRVCVCIFVSRSRGSAKTGASCSPRLRLFPRQQFSFSQIKNLQLTLHNERLCTHLKLSEARSRMEDVSTLTPCGSPTSLFALFALRVPSSSVNGFLKIDVVLAKRS